jgi:hypothetical protein
MGEQLLYLCAWISNQKQATLKMWWRLAKAFIWQQRQQHC